MKRFLALWCGLLFFALASNAQVYMDFSQYETAQNVTLKCKIQDANTHEALPYATAYLIPQGDTTITHFAVSNEKGSVKIEDIVPGKYEFNVELIGYNPFKKVYDMSGWEKNLGTIELEENPDYIDAATITALGNPVTVKKDTLEYNATAFHVGENAMLEDLLKKMPGMEVSSDGTVKVNGEKVDKITVGGKTFFFNDPAMAVKNLPAKIVEKIKVIDKNKEDAEFTGVATKADKEKVMDVELKEEYREGWFGNVKLAGGSTLVPEENKAGQPGMLFNGNSLIAGYNDEDQLTIVGNGKNVDDPDAVSLLIVDYNELGTDALASRQGIETSAQAGANYNTTRLKGFTSNASVNYTFNHKDSREKSARTSFQQSASDLITNEDFIGSRDKHKFNTSFELSKDDNSKYLLTLRPSFAYTSQDTETSNTSETASDGQRKNSSVYQNTSRSGMFVTRTDYSLGIKNLGKERRSLTLSGSYNFRNIAGNSTEMSVTDYSTYSDTRNLLYDDHDRRHAMEGILTYVEPIAEKWSLQGRVTGCYIGSRTTKDAFNGEDGSVNDYYSAVTNNDDWLVRERLLTQWKNDDASVLFGVQVDQEQNVTFSRSLGDESTVGTGRWMFNWSPYAEIDRSWDNSSLYVNYSGVSETPSGSQIIPALDINNPVQMTAGNIYLRPSFYQSAYLSYDYSNPKNYTYLSLMYSCMTYTNEVVSATWFDPDGNRYAIPVNSKKPSFSPIILNVVFRTPLDSERRFSFTMKSILDCSFNTSYQAKTQLPGLDKDDFDYQNMMDWFWGNEDGDAFYSGQSGFAESRTSTISCRMNPSLRYRRDNFSATVSANVINATTRYSLNPDADINTWDFTTDADILYSAHKGWEFASDASYNVYRGYSAGYGDPEFIWNTGISKRIRSVTLSINMNDILNQRRSLSRTATEGYVQDVSRNVVGRHVLFGISFNFGKMNAKNNAQAQNAMINMVL